MIPATNRPINNLQSVGRYTDNGIIITWLLSVLLNNKVTGNKQSYFCRIQLWWRFSRIKFHSMYAAVTLPDMTSAFNIISDFICVHYFNKDFSIVLLQHMLFLITQWNVGLFSSPWWKKKYNVINGSWELMCQSMELGIVYVLSQNLYRSNFDTVGIEFSLLQGRAVGHDPQGMTQKCFLDYWPFIKVTDCEQLFPFTQQAVE